MKKHKICKIGCDSKEKSKYIVIQRIKIIRKQYLNYIIVYKNYDFQQI